MDMINIVVGLLSAGSLVAGWFLRQLWYAVNQLKQELSHLEVRIAREYVPYDRLTEHIKPIMEALSEIKETLKTKADK